MKVHFDHPQYRIRTIPNLYGSAQAAADAWLRGSLWGQPVEFGPQNIHVYGLWKKRWRRVHVRFTKEFIVVQAWRCTHEQQANAD